jgi:hypothetical protein
VKTRLPLRSGLAPTRLGWMSIKRRAQMSARRKHVRAMTGLLEEVVWLMLAVLLVPLAILLVGAPIALCVRAVIEIVRFFP